VRWNLNKLDGQHLVTHQFEEAPKSAKWDFTINICNALKPDDKIPKDHQCPINTRICGIKSTWDVGKNDSADIQHWVAIAGDFTMSNGVHLDITPTRLKNSVSTPDTKREGLRLEILEGRDPFEKQKGTTQVKQKAIVELICDKAKTGWEPLPEPSVKSSLDGVFDNTTASIMESDEAGAIQYISYQEEPIRGENWGVLRLEWKTKYACEDAAVEHSGSEGWGFFTWFIILLFLGTAAYVIFGSWINYNRYGARGFDAVPYADTIRDIPYIVKDWARRLQGSSSRGGYSAV